MTALQPLPPVNPRYAARVAPRPAEYARLPRAPRTGSPVPHLTSLYHSTEPGPYGDRSYPGNCGGNLIKDVIRFLGARSVYDPLTGSGTCRDVCAELGVYCWSSDLREGQDACDPTGVPRDCFDLAWIHPPYWRMKEYGLDPRDLSRAPTLDAFLDRYRQLLAATAGAVVPGGTLAVLMGDYQDIVEGFVPLVYHTKNISFSLGLRQRGTDIIRFSHGASSGRKAYTSSFIPGLHDTLVLFTVPGKQ